jgi:septum formation protein
MTAPAIYLASRSPRRQELLQQIGVGFDVLRMREAAGGRDPDVVEGAKSEEPAGHYVERISRTKAGVAWQKMLARHLPERPILAADTEVALDGEIFGKPADARSAAAMIARLSGRTHDVMTGVAVRWQDDVLFALSDSRVTFKRLKPSEIEAYIATSEPFDKAGGYAIQGVAAAFIARIEGSYSGVMGLPLFETADLLARVGFPVL